MKILRHLNPGLVIFLLFLLTVAACNDSKQPPSTNQNENSQNTVLDTGKINEALREYNASEQRISDSGGTLRRILREAIAMGYNDQSCYLLMDFARHHADQGNFDSTLHYFKRAKQYCYKPVYDKTLPASFLNEFGAFYFGLQSDYLSANNSYYEAIRYLKANDLTENELTINLYIYLHGTQDKLGHPDQALSYLEEGEKLAKKLDSRQALIAIWASFGDFYAKQKNYRKAADYYDLALEQEKHYWDAVWDPNILITALAGKGSVLTETGEAAKAIPLLKKALKVAKENQIIYSEVAASIVLAAAYNKLGRHNEALQLVTSVLKMQEMGFSWYKEVGYQVLMDAYEGLGQYKAALEYQRKLNDWQDSVMNKEKTIALNELDLKYQTANKDKEIASKKLQIEQQRNKLSRKNILISGISVVAVLALLILIVLYKNATYKQNLQELELKTLKRQQEINILRSTMKGEEQERKRLSRELHDGIGSMISSSIMKLSMLRKSNSQAVAQNEYDEVLQLLQETGSEVRKTAHNIMPDIVEKQTLQEAVKNYCETITQGSGLDIDVQFYGDTSGFSSHCKLVIYRIIQELVHNIVKHAHATHAIVQCVVNEDNFALTIEDNGTGFDPASSHKGIGLKNVESRIRSLFGEFHIESAPGKGTSLYTELDCRHLNQEVPSSNYEAKN